MNTLKDKVISVKNHVIRNRGRYCFIAGAATGIALNQKSIQGWNEFLDEKGLAEEFYQPEE